MEVKQIKLIYFSATGTTQKVLESIAKRREKTPVVYRKSYRMLWPGIPKRNGL
ncbi:MAG: hypothetical protein ACQ9MH_20875 [Nitrospinales bacterium]